MLETPAASMKLPKDLKERFIDAYSERYLGALYSYGDMGRPYVNWVYPFSTQYDDAILRKTSEVIHGARVKILPYVSGHQHFSKANISYAI